jgi:hypothetical protein
MCSCARYEVDARQHKVTMRPSPTCSVTATMAPRGTADSAGPVGSPSAIARTYGRTPVSTRGGGGRRRGGGVRNWNAG